MTGPDLRAEAIAQIADLSATLETARGAYLRSAVEIAELGVQLDGVADRLDGRSPRRGMTTWRIREITARKLWAAAMHDAREDTDRWTRELQEGAMRPRRRRRQENRDEH